jgi:WD40 repeat protein
VPGGHVIGELTGPGEPLLTAAFSSDGTRLVTAGGDGTAVIRAASDGRPLLTLAVDSGQTIRAAFSPDGSRVVTLYANTDGRIWDTSSGREVGRVPVSPSSGRRPDSAVFNPDGSRILTLDFGKMRLWDTASGQLLREFENRALIASFSPDGARLAIAARRRMTDGDGWDIQQWDAATGGKIGSTAGTARPAAFLAYSPDGTRIMFGDDQDIIRVWDTKDGKRWTVPRSSRAGSMVGGMGWAKDGTPLVLTCDQSGS